MITSSPVAQNRVSNERKRNSPALRHGGQQSKVAGENKRMEHEQKAAFSHLPSQKLQEIKNLGKTQTKKQATE